MRDLRQFASAAEVAEAAAGLFVTLSGAAIEERGTFFVALAGGTTPVATYRLLATSPRASKLSWERIHVFFGDERCVPAGHPDRNDAAAMDALLSRVPIPSKNVHPVQAMQPDAAEIYEVEIRAVVGREGENVPSFDLIMLGMGPDGHTASLFPGDSSLEEERRLVVKINDAPKPPPERITFTLPLINAARCVAFLVTGEDKKDALARLLRGEESLPAARVSPSDGTLSVLADEVALSLSKHAPPSAARGTSS